MSSSAASSLPTARSAACSVRNWLIRRASRSSVRSGPNRVIARMCAGLSETSGSSNDGGRHGGGRRRAPVLRRRGRGRVRRRRRVDHEHRSVGGADELLGPCGEHRSSNPRPRRRSARWSRRRSACTRSTASARTRPSGSTPAARSRRARPLGTSPGTSRGRCGTHRRGARSRRGRVIERLEPAVQEALPVHARSCADTGRSGSTLCSGSRARLVVRPRRT